MADSCDKAAYSSERRARRAARKVSDAAGDRFRAYPCPDCGRWHLTSTAKRHQRGQGKRLNRSSHRRREPVRSIQELEARARAMRGGGPGDRSD